MTDINVKTLNYIKSCKKQKTPRHVILTKQFLTKHNLLAVPFDKGIGYCLMPRDVYEQKLNPIINLPQFEKLEDKRKNAKHPVLKEEERVCEVLNVLKRDGKISDELYTELKPVGSQPPRLYGLAKVHKENTPLRPIVSMPGSAYQNIAKKIASWLSLVPECGINTSTSSVVENLKTGIKEDEILLSFDVTSLYTNVPVKESILYCADLLFKKVHFSSLDKDTFITLAELCCCNVVFSTHDGYYVQKDGLAMGSPPAPHLANGWLSKYDSIIQDESSLYARYMDDILCNIKYDEVQERFDMINSLHPKLSFTFEIENNSCISFLDMVIHNDRGKLSSSWFRKPTDTGLTLNFHALSPMKYKRSVVISFVYRIYRSCSTWSNFHTCLTDAINILENNQYPSEFYMPIINKTLQKLVSVEDDVTDDVNDGVSISNSLNESMDGNACLHMISEKDRYKFFLQYRGKETDKFVSALKRLNAPCNFILTTRKVRTVLPSLKPAVPEMLLSKVVYKLECPGCHASYVGQTVRHAGRRLREHLRSRGVMRAHLESCDYCNQIDVDENSVISILGKSSSLAKLLTLEALFIEENKPSLNSKDEFRSRTLTLKLY